MINVVIVDDHALVRLGMKRLLDDVRDLMWSVKPKVVKLPLI